MTRKFKCPSQALTASKNSQPIMKVAVVQMVSGADLESNLAAAESLLAEAAQQGAQLALLPENFALFDSLRLADLAACELQTRQIRHRLASWAQSYQLAIVAGTLPLPSKDGRAFAASLLFDQSGQCLARYDKRHLFDAQVADGKGRYSESRYIAPGTEPVLAELAQAKIGLTVCYDLRFPSSYWALREQGANLFTVPSAFTQVTTQAHWEVLLRARAIETQCFVLGANQGGDHGNNRTTGGQSMIVSPWGEVLARCDMGQGVAVATLDFAAQRELRQRMPVLEHCLD